MRLLTWIAIGFGVLIGLAVAGAAGLWIWKPGVDKNRIAIVGTSKGAEAALLVATRHPQLRAVAAGVPSSVAWAGINWDYGGGDARARRTRVRPIFGPRLRTTIDYSATA